MNDNYIVTRNAVIIKMYKPLYGSLYYIRDKYIQIAKKRRIPLVIESPTGKATYTASEWMKGAEKMEKVFNFPDNPMILWGRHIKHDVEKRDERKKVEKKLESTRIEPNVKIAFMQRLIKKDPELAKKLGLV